MAKKKHAKKYVNVIEQQKQQEARYKNLFMDKLRNLCAQIGSPTLFHQIPMAEKILIYMFRGAPLKVVVAEGAKIQKRLMDALVKIIKSHQLTMKLEVVKGSGEMMTYADYLLVGMSLEYHADSSEADYPGKERFAKFVELRKEREDTYEKGILNICALACWVFDDIGRKYLHTCKLETTIPGVDSGIQLPRNDVKVSRREVERITGQDFRLHQKVTIGIHPLETRKISIGGEIHSGIQVGMLFQVNYESQFHHFTLSLDDIRLKQRNPFSKSGLPIYIQQHALDRMRERLGIDIPAFYNVILMEAVMHGEIILMAKNRMLITCYTNELKIGYFLAEATNSVILIRTFLLLTNGGTPEGDKLSRLTGLQTNDRKYLAIDTLQGLANSDIEQNEPICNLFRAAGCGSILELCKKINNEPGMMWLLNTSQPKNIIADLISEYLKPNTDEEEYMEYVS
jgi:hypothetical protein